MGTQQIGIRLHDVEGATIEDKVRRAHEQGFKCAQVALTKLIADYPADDGILTPGFAMYLRKLFASYDMDISVLGCYLNLATPDSAELERSLRRYRAHIRFASYLDGTVVGTETGAPNTTYTYEPACRGEEAFGLLRDNLGIVVDYAERMGVPVAFEPVADHVVYSPMRARRLLDEIDSPNLRVILDPVNLIRGDEYEGFGELLEEAFELIGSEIDVIHLKDFRLADGKVIPCELGAGVMDYSGLAAFIHSRKPFIHCLLENTTAETAERALRVARGL